MRTFRLFTAITALLLLASCGGDDKDFSGDFGAIRVPDTRPLEQTAAASDTQAQAVTFSTDAAWTSSIASTRADAPGWITVSPDHGDAAGSYTIRLGLQPNTEKESRGATVTVRCGSSSIEIRITQLGDDEGDEPAERVANGRLLRMTEYRDDAVESVYDFSYDDRGRITALKMYGDAAMKELWAEYLFAYEETTEMTCTRRFYDKQPAYGYSATYTGRFEGNHSRIEERREEYTEEDGSRTLVEESYTYGIPGIERIAVEETRRIGSADEYRNSTQVIYSYDERFCTRIDYDPTQTGEAPCQTFEYDKAALAFANDPLFHAQGGPAVNPALCVIAEPDMLRALGFYFDRWEFVPLPSRVVTEYGGRTVDTFRYRKLVESLRVDEKADAAEMIVTRSTTGSTSRYVLTYLGI